MTLSNIQKRLQTKQTAKMVASIGNQRSCQWHPGSVEGSS